MPIHAPFLGVFGHISPNDVTHRPNPKKDHPLAEPRHCVIVPNCDVGQISVENSQF